MILLLETASAWAHFEAVIWKIFIAEDQGHGMLGSFRTGTAGPLLEGPHSLGLFGEAKSQLHLYPFADIDSPPGLLLRHLWNIDKKSYFQNPKAQDMARVTQCSTFSPHIWELLSLSITSSEKILTTWKASAWPGLLGPMYI